MNRLKPTSTLALRPAETEARELPAAPLPDIAEYRQWLAKGEISAMELLDAHIQRIERSNPILNAMPTLCLERAKAEAKRLDGVLATQRKKSGASGTGPLAGLAYCAKDMFDTEGVRTTYGSALFKDRMPKQDAEVVRRIRAAGAVLVGKSNTPEFAAGSQTFNKVFGATKNPWDASRTCGGSTGGGAVALITGMVTLADGSDLAASLRNPANFCGIAGLRPSSHLEPRLQTGLNTFNTLSMVGPMGRTVADIRELFLAIFDPQGCQADRPLADWVKLRAHQEAARERALAQRKLRIGWAPHWASLPVQKEIDAHMRLIHSHLQSMGVELVEGFPKLPDVRDAFLALRGEFFVAELGEIYARHPKALKDTIVWNIEQGMKVSVTELVNAQKTRAAARERIELFMKEHGLDAIAGPTNQVLPFDLNTPYITEINGKKLDSYIDWLASNFIFTVAGLPAISIPAGFTREPETGSMMPVGLQLVGRWGQDMALMDAAQAIEAMFASAEKAH